MTSFDDLPDDIKEYIYEIWAVERARRVRARKAAREYRRQIRLAMISTYT
mgnify:CR=1 FL=1|jgi:hypothetical protein